jgi:hypothetical protein
MGNSALQDRVLPWCCEFAGMIRYLTVFACLALLVATPMCTAAVPDARAGIYENTQLGKAYTITGSGTTLYAKLSGQDALPISESRPDHYYYTSIQAYIEFVRKNGSVVGLILTQHGMTMPFVKLDAGGNPLISHVIPQYPPVVTLDDATLASYAGNYGGNRTLTIGVEHRHVFAQIAGQAVLEIFPSGRDMFYYTTVDAIVTFNRDASGNIRSLTLDQNGAKSMWAKRN